MYNKGGSNALFLSADNFFNSNKITSIINETRTERPMFSLGNTPHFATPSLICPRNDIWETSAEIPYWWRVTTQIWAVLLIGWKSIQSELQPGSGWWRVISMGGISALVSLTSFSGETSGGVAKCQLFSQANPYNVFLLFVVVFNGQKYKRPNYWLRVFIANNITA